MQRLTPRQPLFDVREHERDDLMATGHRAGVVTKQAMVGFSEQIGVTVSGATDHDAVHGLELLLNHVEASKATVDLNQELRKLALEAMNVIVTKRGDRAIFLRTEPAQQSLTGMNYESITAARSDYVHKVSHVFVPIQVIDTDAMLNSDWDRDHAAHRRHRISNAVGMFHQTGTKVAGLNPWTRTANV